MTNTVDAEKPASAEQLAGDSHTIGQRVHEILHKQPALSPAVVLVLACLVFAFLSDRFFTANNISIVIQQVAVVGILAVGQTLIILTAGIDLSVGAIAALASFVMAKLVFTNHDSAFIALLIGAVIAILAATLNGVLVTRIKLPPFIVTLGTLSIFTAISLRYAQGQTIQLDPSSKLLWPNDPISIGSFSINNGVLLMVGLYLVIGFALRFTAWGRHLYATGDDGEAARLAGIRTDRVILSAYVVAGVAYAIGAWALVGRVGGGDPNSGTDLNLQSITAVVIGGTSLFGGRGRVLGTIIGAVIVQVFYNGLSVAGYEQEYRVLAVGVLVIIAVSVDQWIRKVKA